MQKHMPTAYKKYIFEYATEVLQECEGTPDWGLDEGNGTKKPADGDGELRCMNPMSP